MLLPLENPRQNSLPIPDYNTTLCGFVSSLWRWLMWVNRYIIAEDHNEVTMGWCCLLEWSGLFLRAVVLLPKCHKERRHEAIMSVIHGDSFRRRPLIIQSFVHGLPYQSLVVWDQPPTPLLPASSLRSPVFARKVVTTIYLRFPP